MLYFKQIEIGPMQNYVYLIGSTETRKVAVVDAAWEIDTILKIAAQDDVEDYPCFRYPHPPRPRRRALFGNRNSRGERAA